MISRSAGVDLDAAVDVADRVVGVDRPRAARGVEADVARVGGRRRAGRRGGRGRVAGLEAVVARGDGRHRAAIDEGVVGGGDLEVGGGDLDAAVDVADRVVGVDRPRAARGVEADVARVGGRRRAGRRGGRGRVAGLEAVVARGDGRHRAAIDEGVVGGGDLEVGGGDLDAAVDVADRVVGVDRPRAARGVEADVARVGGRRRAGRRGGRGRVAGLEAVVARGDGRHRAAIDEGVVGGGDLEVGGGDLDAAVDVADRVVGVDRPRAARGVEADVARVGGRRRAGRRGGRGRVAGLEAVVARGDGRHRAAIDEGVVGGGDLEVGGGDLDAAVDVADRVVGVDRPRAARG